MAFTSNDILNVTLGIFDMPAGGYWLNNFTNYATNVQNEWGLTDDETMAELARALVKSPQYQESIEGLDNLGLAQKILSSFGLEDNLDMLLATEAAVAAFDPSNIDGEIAALIWGYTKGLTQDADVMAAYPDAAATLANKLAVAVEVSVTNPTATTDAAALQALVANIGPDSTNVDVGSVYTLTSGTDTGSDFVGTNQADEFVAPIIQNAFAGGVSNSLSTADVLDGSAGLDVLKATLVNEFVGATADRMVDVQPTTSNIEIVEIEARDIVGDNQAPITLDAKKMTDIDKIGSEFSDGDLVIENLTTLESNGNKRNTEDLTVTMTHTDNFNSDSDASDLTVLFDEDYLLTGQTTSGATLTIRLLNAVQNEAGNNPVEGFSEITFNVGDEEVTVDITSVATDGAQDFTTAYAEIADLINAQLASQGITTVTASAPALEDAVFSIPVAGFSTGDDAGDYYPIILTNTGAEALTGVDIATSALQYDTDLNNSFSTTDAATNSNPVTINVELEKVGRDGEGGNLMIGGKDYQSTGNDDTDVDQTNGIEKFNITVIGDEDKPSNLGQIISTDDALKTVMIESETRTDGSYAALTVRGEDTDGKDVNPFGGTLDTLNANAFMGDLVIGTNGEGADALNIDMFTATGGGDVTYWAEYTNLDGFASLDANTFTTTTGAGNDTLVADANDGAQLTITSGAGDDNITVTIDGADDSGSTDTKAWIASSGGDNTVSVSSSDTTHEADITLGSGADTVTGNSVIINASTGAGNDTVYTNNTAAKTVVENDLADMTITGATAIGSTTGAGATPDQSELLFGRSVVVTLATNGAPDADEFVEGFESIAVDIDASNGYLTTATDLHNAIAEAINTDPVLSKLASASVDSNGTLLVEYSVDGVVDLAANNVIEYTITGDWADLNSTAQNAIVAQLEEQYADSDLIVADVQAAYDTANITTAQAIADNGDGANGADSADGENNTVNGGLGDDVLVLSSDDAAIDTLMIDANGFGNDTIVHFEAGLNGDIIDFAHLSNVTSLSGSSVSEQAVAGTVVAATAIVENTVVQVSLADLTDNDAGAGVAMTYATLTNAGVLNEINAGAGDFGIGAVDANLVGNLVNSVFLIENPNNAGDYKVYEVVYNTGTAAFTEATLVGTLDFGASTGVLDDTNIA